MKYVREWQGLGPRIEVSSFHCSIDVAFITHNKEFSSFAMSSICASSKFQVG